MVRRPQGPGRAGGGFGGCQPPLASQQLALTVDDQQRTIRRRVEAAPAGQDGALERLQENALGDLQYLLASLDAATLISRVEVALADAVRACARGNALEGAKILAGALTRAV